MSVIDRKPGSERTVFAQITGVNPSVSEASKDVEIVSLLKKYNERLPIGFLANITNLPYSTLLGHLDSLSKASLVDVDPDNQTVALLK